MNNVGINAMLHGHTSYGGICSGASRNHLKFEFGAVITPLGGASLARHGVHDVHRAHYLNLSAAIQDVSGQTLTDEVLKLYKSLADIERGFRVLKSEIEIGPVYHRLPARIRAHAAICFMALILYRVMRLRLRAGDTQLSPERALAKLRRIQHHQVILNDAQPVTGLSTISQEHTAILAALTIKKPTLNAQLTLL